MDYSQLQPCGGDALNDETLGEDVQCQQGKVVVKKAADNRKGGVMRKKVFRKQLRTPKRVAKVQFH